MTDVVKNPGALAEALQEEVAKAGPEKGLRGSAAGMLLRLLEPGFDPTSYGTESLRQFIARYAPDLQVLGFSGTDPIYGLKGWAGGVPRSARGPKYLWRIWVSPLSPAALVINRASGEISAVPRSYRQKEGEVKVAPAPVEAHRAMAREFLKSQSFDNGVADALSGAVGSADSSWWRAWTEVLRSRVPEALPRWHEYRQKALEVLLEQALRGAGLDEVAAKSTFDSIVGTRTEKTHAPPATRATSNGTARSLPTGATSGRGDALALVQAVVARMTEDQLRALPLPLGLVLDALGAKRG